MFPLLSETGSGGGNLTSWARSLALPGFKAAGEKQRKEGNCLLWAAEQIVLGLRQGGSRGDPGVIRSPNSLPPSTSYYLLSMQP